LIPSVRRQLATHPGRSPPSAERNEPQTSSFACPGEQSAQPFSISSWLSDTLGPLPTKSIEKPRTAGFVKDRPGRCRLSFAKKFMCATLAVVTTSQPVLGSRTRPFLSSASGFKKHTSQWRWPDHFPPRDLAVARAVPAQSAVRDLWEIVEFPRRRFPRVRPSLEAKARSRSEALRDIRGQQVLQVEIEPGVKKRTTQDLAFCNYCGSGKPRRSRRAW